MTALLFFIQSLSMIWIGILLLGRTAPKWMFITCAMCGITAATMAAIAGIPWWTSYVFGDGYDHGFIAWIAACAAFGFSRWIKGERT